MHPDSLLWMWTTNRHLVGGEASQILKHWGFRPVTLLTWVKERVGTGVWLRGQTEHAVLAVRGMPIQPLKPESTLLRAPCTGTHSTKPDAFYELVERHLPRFQGRDLRPASPNGLDDLGELTVGEGGLTKSGAGSTPRGQRPCLFSSMMRVDEGVQLLHSTFHY